MRLTARSFLGIEITDQYVKIAEAQVSRDSAIASRAVVAPIRPEWMEEGKMVDPASMALYIRKLLFEHHFNVKHVHFTIPSQHILVRFLKFPNIPDKDLRKVVTFEVQHNVHMPFERPYFDYARVVKAGEHPAVPKKKPKPKKADKPEEGAEDKAWLEAAPSSAGKDPFSFLDQSAPDKQKEDAGTEPEAEKCEVMLVAAPAELVDQYLQLAEFCGLAPLSVEIKALSVMRLLAFNQWTYRDKTFLLVDVNETTTDVSVFSEGVLRLTRSVQFPFGEHAPKAPEPDPNELFAEFAAPVASEFDNSCRDLGNELERVMNFYKYSLNNRNQEFDYILLTGDIPRMAEVRLALAERMNQPVGLLDPGAIQVADGIAVPLHAIAAPVGLALRGKST